MPHLTIGFDASSTLAPRTGVGRAALGLLQGLTELEESGLDLRVFMNSLTRRTGAEHAFLGEASVPVTRRRKPGAWLVKGWAAGKGPTAEELLGPGIDLFHAPAGYVPPASKAKRIASVYDVAFLDDPPAQREALGGALFAEWFPRLLPEVDLVHTASEWSRARLMETYGLAEDRVAVVPLGIDPKRFRVENVRLVEVLHHDLGIPAQTYLLGIGGPEPRKRAELLLDVYARLREAEPATPPLAVIGWGGKPHPALKARPALHRHVHVLPWIGDDRLAALYTGAVATIVPSREEGFGFPVLEAMACGSPVVCGRHSSLAEIGGDAALFVEGADPDEWVEALQRVAFDQEEHDRWKERGLQQAARFRWEETARRFQALYWSLS